MHDVNNQKTHIDVNETHETEINDFSKNRYDTETNSFSSRTKIRTDTDIEHLIATHGGRGGMGLGGSAHVGNITIDNQVPVQSQPAVGFKNVMNGILAGAATVGVALSIHDISKGDQSYLKKAFGTKADVITVKAPDVNVSVPQQRGGGGMTSDQFKRIMDEQNKIQQLQDSLRIITNPTVDKALTKDTTALYNANFGADTTATTNVPTLVNN